MHTIISQRFHGPAASGNGGYTCGITAMALTDGPADVRLQRPPPLERPLELAVTDEGAQLLDGSDVVATAQAVDDVAVELPSPITFEEATEAAAAFDVDTYRAHHPFPGCFTCGPAREPGDGLRIFPAHIPRADAIASPWVPHSSLAATSDSGLIAREFVWAALDCPSGLAWTHHPEPAPPHVLGRLAARIHRTPKVGERSVAAGWLLDIDGRKRHSASAIWSAEGELLAAASATWVALTEEQFAQFRVATA